MSPSSRAFLGNVATLMAGKGGAFAIALLAMPIIARLFDPSDFGVAAFLLAVIGVLEVVATGRYDIALVLLDSRADAARLAWFAVYLCLVAAALLLLVALLTYALRGTPPFHANLGWVAWCVPIGVALSGIMRVSEGWCVRGKHFRRMATGDVINAGGNSGLRVLGGLAFGSTVWALIASYFAAMIAKIALLSRGFSIRQFAVEARDLSGMRALAARYSDFPRYNATAEFARSFAQKLPVLMLGYLFAPAIVGFFAMGLRLVQTPLGLLVNSFRRVFLQRTAELYNEGRSLRGPLLKATGLCLLLALGPFFVLWFYGEEILTVFLGERWATAGRYAEILAPFLLSTWVTTPSSATLVIIRRQGLWLAIQLTVAAAQFAAMVAANHVVGTPEATINAHVMVGVIGNIGVVALTFWRVAGTREESA